MIFFPQSLILIFSILFFSISCTFELFSFLFFVNFFLKLREEWDESNVRAICRTCSREFQSTESTIKIERDVVINTEKEKENISENIFIGSSGDSYESRNHKNGKEIDSNYNKDNNNENHNTDDSDNNNDNENQEHKNNSHNKKNSTYEVQAYGYAISNEAALQLGGEEKNKKSKKMEKKDENKKYEIFFAILYFAMFLVHFVLFCLILILLYISVEWFRDNGFPLSPYMR